jgi:hypothetical protein
MKGKKSVQSQQELIFRAKDGLVDRIVDEEINSSPLGRHP